MIPELYPYPAELELQLYPVVEMLLFKKDQLDKAEWITLLRLTLKSIQNNPEQYLSSKYFMRETFAYSVWQIFEKHFKETSTIAKPNIKQHN